MQTEDVLKEPDVYVPEEPLGTASPTAQEPVVEEVPADGSGEEGGVEVDPVEEELQRIEQRADELATPQEEEEPVADPDQPTIEDKLNWALGKIAELSETREQPPVATEQATPQQERSGYDEIYGEPQDSPENTNNTVSDPRITQILAHLQEQNENLQKQGDYIGYLYKENLDLKQWKENDEAERKRQAEHAKLREKFGADDQTIERYRTLIERGEHIDAMELLRGRSTADRAREKMLAERESDRSMAGQDAYGGGSSDGSPVVRGEGAPSEASMIKEYQEYSEMGSSPAKDIAFVKFIQKYGDSGRDYLRQTLVLKPGG